MRGENMSSHHISVRSLVSRKLVGAFFAVFALVAQPLLAINVPSVAAMAGSVHTTNLSTWDTASQTRSKGHNELVDGGLRIWTEDNSSLAKAAGYYDVEDASLAQFADFSLSWTGTSPAPGGQLVVDMNNNGVPDGILVIESVYSGNQWLASRNTADLDLTNAPTVGGGGGPYNGTFTQWLSVYPNAKVLAIGYSLGSGILGDGVISQITAGGINYTFGLPAIAEVNGQGYSSLQAAVTAATPGSTVTVKAGTHAVTSTILVNKSLTITGEAGAVITTSGSNHVFVTTAPNVTISHLSFTKTDKMNQNLINIQGANTTISSNIFSGQYTLATNDHTSRALEVSTTSGLNISGNQFNNLRQPAYINDGTQGTVSNNYVNETRGWVAVANTNLVFSGNSWGVNAVDIAFIPGAPNNYTDIVSISDANNGAAIHNQSSGKLSVVYVNGMVVASGNGYQQSPYKTIAEALAVVANEGTIKVTSDLTLTQQLTLDKPVKLDGGSGHVITGSFTKTNNSNNSVIGVQSDNVTISNLTVDAGNVTNQLHGINVYESEDVNLSDLTVLHGRTGVVVGQGSIVYINGITTSGNAWHGINVDKAGAYLAISGTNSHDSAVPAIFVDDNSVIAGVDDVDGQYSVFEAGHADTYVLTSSLQTGSDDTVTLPAANGTVTSPVNRAIQMVRGNVTVTLPAGTTVTANSTAWNGTINAPTNVSYTIPGSYQTGIAITVGSPDYTLNFTTPVKLVFAGQAGKQVGFIPAGSTTFTEITATCNSLTTPTVATGEACKINDGTDLVVWTTHFTTFVTYSQTESQSGGQSSSANDGTVQPMATTATATPVSPTNRVVAVNDSPEATDTVETNYGEVLGTSTKKAAKTAASVAEPSKNGWMVAGLAWYWWVAIIAALGAAGWAGYSWYRRNGEA